MSWSEPLIPLGAAVVAGVGGGFAVARFLAAALARHSPARVPRVAAALLGPCLWTGPLVFLALADPYADWAYPVAHVVAQAQHVALIVATGWLFLRLLVVGEALLSVDLEGMRPPGWALHPARRQLSLLRKGMSIVVGLMVVALILRSFVEGRPVGTVLLAALGAGAILVGIAAHQPMRNAVAGLLILLTGILRVDDEVVVDGEAGTVEELALTHAIVRRWDLRRVVLPLAHVLEKPFLRGLRASPNPLGAVTLWGGLDTDINRIRQVFLEVVQASQNWDRRCARLAVTDASESAVQIRCLMSAATAAQLWDLRCEVRERLLAALRGGANPSAGMLGPHAWLNPRDGEAVTPAELRVRHT